MSASFAEGRRGGNKLTFTVAAVALGLFGLVGGLPDLLGPAIGIGGLAVAAWARRRGPLGTEYGALPALVGLLVLATTAPTVASAELFGGLSALAVLLWVADDPARPAGGGRRAALPLASCGLAVGIAWSVALVLPHPSQEVGLAGGLLASVLLVLAYFLVREAERRASSSASA